MGVASILILSHPFAGNLAALAAPAASAPHARDLHELQVEWLRGGGERKASGEACRAYAVPQA